MYKATSRTKAIKTDSKFAKVKTLAIKTDIPTYELQVEATYYFGATVFTVAKKLDGNIEFIGKDKGYNVYTLKDNLFYNEAIEDLDYEDPAFVDFSFSPVEKIASIEIPFKIEFELVDTKIRVVNLD